MTTDVESPNQDHENSQVIESSEENEEYKSKLVPHEIMDKPCECKSRLHNNTQINPSFVFAIGQIEPKFSSKSVEKEYYQVLTRSKTEGQSDEEVLRSVLSKRENRYLARQMCWVFTIEGLEAYILYPHDPADYELLIESLRAPARRADVDVVIGRKGPLAPPEVCNGLTLPILQFEQIYSFEVDKLTSALPKPEKAKVDKYITNAEGEFYKIMQMADNFGNTDEHRCLNFLAVRYSGFYEKTNEMYEKDCSLVNIEVIPSRLSGSRKIFDAIFTYKNRKTDVDEKYFCRVDVTEMFPFLVTKISPYYDR